MIASLSHLNALLIAFIKAFLSLASDIPIEIPPLFGLTITGYVNPKSVGSLISSFFFKVYDLATLILLLINISLATFLLEDKEEENESGPV